MTESERLYDVAGVTFGVKLEAPWSFMHYTEPVAERIKIAAAGGIVPVMPTRAGDSEPPRTYVQKRVELPEDYGPHVLDFSQYEPFATEESSKMDFRLTVCNGQPDEFRQAQKEGQVTKLMSETEVLPYYYVYRWKEGTVFEFEGADGKIDSTLLVENGAESGYFWAGEKMRPYSVIFQICFALRIMYTYNSHALFRNRAQRLGRAVSRHQRHRKEHPQPPLARKYPGRGAPERRQSCTSHRGG